MGKADSVAISTTFTRTTKGCTVSQPGVLTHKWVKEKACGYPLKYDVPYGFDIFTNTS